MKNIFVVHVVGIDSDRYAIADTIRAGENLAHHVNRYGGNVCHLCESRAQAERLAQEWNADFDRNRRKEV